MILTPGITLGVFFCIFVNKKTMITLKNGTKGKSQVGYLAKVVTGKDGYFDYACDRDWETK